MTTDAPCRTCTHRHAGCHTDCEKYKDWCDTRNAELRQSREAKASENLHTAYIVTLSRKIKKAMRKRK